MAETDSTVFDYWKMVTDTVGTRVLQELDSSEYLEKGDSEPHKRAKSKAKEIFLEQFAERSWKYLLLVGIIVGSIVILDFSICGKVPNQSYGLAMDFAGAAILGRGLLKGSIPIANESVEGYNYNIEVIESSAKDSIDGVFGIFFLLMGIGLQIFAVAFPHFSLSITAQFAC
jgi:hypothetical protein